MIVYKIYKELHTLCFPCTFLLLVLLEIVYCNFVLGNRSLIYSYFLYCFRPKEQDFERVLPLLCLSPLSNLSLNSLPFWFPSGKRQTKQKIGGMGLTDQLPFTQSSPLQGHPPLSTLEIQGDEKAFRKVHYRGFVYTCSDEKIEISE